MEEFSFKIVKMHGAHDELVLLSSNSSKADKDDATLIEPIELAA